MNRLRVGCGCTLRKSGERFTTMLLEFGICRSMARNQTNKDSLFDVHVRGSRVLARQMEDVHQDEMHQLDLARSTQGTPSVSQTPKQPSNPGSGGGGAHTHAATDPVGTGQATTRITFWCSVQYGKRTCR